MAKSKLEGHWSQDNLGRDCLVLEKSKGWINQLEVYEWMESHNMSGCSYIHMADCPSDEVPADLYEDGDKWFLYEPEVILGEIVSRASDNTGNQYIITKKGQADDGHFVVCEEHGLTDADLDRYAVQVQNGEGYYNSDGKYVSYDLD